MKLKKYFFFTLFSLLTLIALELPLSFLLGTNSRFTAFDLFSPTAFAQIGLWPGLIALSIVQILNKVIHQNFTFDIINLVRFITPLAAALYFYKPNKYTRIIPLLSILVFLSHPTGREVWYFTLFWVTPIIISFFKNPNTFAKSLGATFTAHAVGGAFWIYAFNLPATFWQTLIPLVIFERLVMASGITLSSLALTNIKSALSKLYATQNHRNKNQEILTSQR